MNECPFEVGEIVVFESSFRFETYIAQVQSIHLEYWGCGWLPQITKATPEQKQAWYENGKYELVIGRIT